MELALKRDVQSKIELQVSALLLMTSSSRRCATGLMVAGMKNLKELVTKYSLAAYVIYQDENNSDQYPTYQPWLE